MNFEKYSNFGSIKGVMLGVVLYAYLLVGISSASTFPNPCGGIRGRFICDDHDPQVFHICLGNQKYTNRCPGDLHYNVRTQNCDWPKAVNCVEEARLHASRTSGKMNMEDRNTVDVLEDSNTIDLYANEDVETIDKGSEQKVPNLVVKKPKFSYDQNPKVQNKNTVSLDVIDKYETPVEERTLEKSKEKELTLEKSKEKELTLEKSKEKELTLEKSKEKELTLEKSKENDDFVVGERQSESEINLKEDITSPKTDNKNIDAKKDIELLNTSDGKEKTNESVSETTTFGVTGEPSPTKPIENDIVGHMIETYKATESPQVFLYTRPIHRQRARRPSISPYQRSPFASPARPPVTTTRRLTTTSRPLTATTAAPPRRPVTTSRSPFKKTTVVYHPFLSNRTKPDYREYAPQLTTKTPQQTRHSPSRDRSKWNPYISPAPYRSATNYDDDRTNTPKWYELGGVKKAMASKPGINSYGNNIGKSASENSLDKDRRERTPHSDIAEQVSEKPFSTTKSSTLSWVKSTTDSVIRRETSAESMERVRNIIKSRSHRARHLKTTSLETQESKTTPFAETTSKLKTKRFKSKTPLSQAWLNERKSHSEINQDYQWSKSIYKKNRWLPTEEQQTTTSDTKTTENVEVTRQSTAKSTIRPFSSRTPSWTYPKTSMYTTDARHLTPQLKTTPSVNAAASRIHSERHQKESEMNAVQESLPKTTNKLPWWSLSTERDTNTSPTQQKDGTERKQISFYRRAFLPREFAHRPNYQTRTPIFDKDAQSSDHRQDKGTLLFKPNEQFSKPKERSFELHKSNSDSENERRFSLHRVTNPSRNDSPGEDRKFALHKALNSKTNQYSAAAAADRRPSGAISAAASSDQIIIHTEELAKDIDDKKNIEIQSPIEKYEYKNGKCSSSWCKLPDCRCIGSDIPGELDAKDIPQMVMLTFDDSINSQNMGYYRTLFNGTAKNPNGCPIKATFFVSGDNSDYDMVRKMYKNGHEIASHTLSHRSPTTWWADAGFDNWEHEIVGMKQRLNEKSGVPLKEITGMRAPFLQVGGDAQYAMLKENKFRYDTSMVTGYLYDNKEPPTWPFTLDTPPDSKTCSLTPCPTRSYPGLWEVPLIRWYGSNRMACAMPDACTIGVGTKGSYKFIEDNFMRHYTTNRAPFGIFIHASWFGRKDGNLQGLVEFLASLADKKDVWVVTVSQALDWIQKPVRLSAINAIESWSC